LLLENYAAPGMLILGVDSHTPNAGGLGACAIPVTGSDAAEIMAGLALEGAKAEGVGGDLSGELSGWTSPKDVIVRLASILGVDGGAGSIIEYFGPGVRSISCTGKATICNMGAELSAYTSLFPYDARMETYLKATGRGALAAAANAHRGLLV